MTGERGSTIGGAPGSIAIGARLAGAAAASRRPCSGLGRLTRTLTSTAPELGPSRRAGAGGRPTMLSRSRSSIPQAAIRRSVIRVVGFGSLGRLVAVTPLSSSRSRARVAAT